MREKHLIRLSLYIALASVLQISELLVPVIAPGVKVGFANIITVIVLFKYSFKDALIVAVMRVIVSSIIIGTFLSPAFLLSFSGAFVSVLVMGSLVSIKIIKNNLSIIGVSIFGALSHSLAQFSTAYFVLVRHMNFLWLLPFIISGSLISGIITGFIAKAVLKKNK